MIHHLRAVVKITIFPRMQFSTKKCQILPKVVNQVQGFSHIKNEKNEKNDLLNQNECYVDKEMMMMEVQRHK
jgi:hypothetical protein